MSSEFVRASQEEYDNRVVTYREVPIVNLMPGANTHIIPGKNVTLSFLSADANAYLKVHSHPHEQMVIVVKGELDAIVEGKYYRIKAGDVVPISGDVEHGLQILGEPCEVLEVFSPARKEFEEKLQQAIAAQK